MSGRGEDTPARRILVSGRVQGVGFRFWTKITAEGLGITGWVRNLPDGRVEAHLEGDPRAVGKMVNWLQRGPAGAAVTSLEEVPAAAEPGLEGFSVRR